ncbi:FAD-dependent monooxygenase [Haladaptatus pallidirubidus]|uniref:FAD-dependent oxidoreductase n=1 Tax=Haladaptatus pallidirubidus TaxID=1008152 RepID=A0AAV3UPF3_9EURY|nr:FAD-dependent monooxygenase [Haladaptatus pallidirubidus]
MTDSTPDESTIKTDIVIVGAGPAGCVLSYLLARSGVETVLLERQRSLEREFRGFLFQPLVLRVFDQMGVLDRVLTLEHTKVHDIAVDVYDRSYPIMSLKAAPGPYNYALLMEQPPLLQALIDEVSQFNSFTYYNGMTASDLLREENQVVGVEATDREHDESIKIHSRLVVGADGRYSTVRNAAGIDPGLFESTLELLWFKLPATAIDDPVLAKVGSAGALLSFGLGRDEAQLGWPIEKGSYPQVRDQGIERLHEQLVAIDPSLATVLPEHLTDFQQCSLLHIEPGISDEWRRDGLLLVGDAAHVASPVGGQGNGMAIQDAVIAHSVIMTALNQTTGSLPAETLRKYESIRRPAVEKVVQFQRRAERPFSTFVKYGDVVPDGAKRPLLRSLFWLISRTPLPKRARDTFMWGPAPVSVDTSYLMEVPRED